MNIWYSSHPCQKEKFLKKNSYRNQRTTAAGIPLHGNEFEFFMRACDEFSFSAITISILVSGIFLEMKRWGMDQCFSQRRFVNTFVSIEHVTDVVVRWKKRKKKNSYETRICRLTWTHWKRKYKKIWLWNAMKEMKKKNTKKLIRVMFKRWA